ncbi:MAG TPA: hypothetical protein VGX94_03720 [Terriglobia bacterium]|nr:hypothetical protein [Terriglobia bacterium]
MLTIKTSVLSGKHSVRDALKKVSTSKDKFLVADVGGRPSLLKQSQLRRVVSASGESELLHNLKREVGEELIVVPKKSLTRFGISSRSGQLSGDVQGLMNDLSQRLALINLSDGQSFLVSASEAHLVDYHCKDNDHSYSPPPAWYEGMKCKICGSEIVREG